MSSSSSSTSPALDLSAHVVIVGGDSQSGKSTFLKFINNQFPPYTNRMVNTSTFHEKTSRPIISSKLNKEVDKVPMVCQFDHYYKILLQYQLLSTMKQLLFEFLRKEEAISQSSYGGAYHNDIVGMVNKVLESDTLDLLEAGAYGNDDSEGNQLIDVMCALWRDSTVQQRFEEIKEQYYYVNDGDDDDGIGGHYQRVVPCWESFVYLMNKLCVDREALRIQLDYESEQTPIGQPKEKKAKPISDRRVMGKADLIHVNLNASQENNEIITESFETNILDFNPKEHNEERNEDESEEEKSRAASLREDESGSSSDSSPERVVRKKKTYTKVSGKTKAVLVGDPKKPPSFRYESFNIMAIPTNYKGDLTNHLFDPNRELRIASNSVTKFRKVASTVTSPPPAGVRVFRPLSKTIHSMTLVYIVDLANFDVEVERMRREAEWNAFDLSKSDGNAPTRRTTESKEKEGKDEKGRESKVAESAAAIRENLLVFHISKFRSFLQLYRSYIVHLRSSQPLAKQFPFNISVLFNKFDVFQSKIYNERKLNKEVFADFRGNNNVLGMQSILDYLKGKFLKELEPFVDNVESIQLAMQNYSLADIEGKVNGNGNGGTVDEKSPSVEHPLQKDERVLHHIGSSQMTMYDFAAAYKVTKQLLWNIVSGESNIQY